MQRLEKRDSRRLVVRREHAVHQQRDRLCVVRSQFQRYPQFTLRLLRSVELKQQLAEIKARLGEVRIESNRGHKFRFRFGEPIEERQRHTSPIMRFRILRISR
jgi:hypothetical protein